MQENNLKGIPYEILTSEKLSDKEKYIYSLKLFFSKMTIAQGTTIYLEIIIDGVYGTIWMKLIKKFLHRVTHIYKSVRKSY